MLTLRYYQREAIDSVYAYWKAKGGNALIELATGTGKSAVAGVLTKELIGGWENLRIGIITHVKELISQNAQEFLGIWPGAAGRMGIHSAGLGKKDVHGQIIFGGIQSIYRSAQILEKGFDVLLIDEAHLVPRDSETMYGKFIDACRQAVPDMRIIGLTATPYRLSTGRLDEGEGRIFDKTVYSYDIGRGVNDGYLCPLTSPRSHTQIKIEGVATRGGEFVQGDLERAIMQDAETVRAACAETVEWMRAQKRKRLLDFCAGVDHANFVHEVYRGLGLRTAVVTGETESRGKLIDALKCGDLEGLVSVGVLTTGTNIPGVDTVSLKMKTLSTGKYVQILGRGTRPIYERGFDMDSAEGRRAAIAAGGKPNCLVLDFGGNGAIHGPVDDLTPSTGQGTAREPRDPLAEKITVDTVRGKYCPECGELQPVRAVMCEDCDYQWPVEARHDSQAHDVAVMKDEMRPDWRFVEMWEHERHEKLGGTPSMRIDYFCGGAKFSDWLCFEHEGGAKRMALQKWMELGGETPAPADVNEALDRTEELMRPTEVLVVRDGQYWRIVAKRFQPLPPVANWSKEIDDEIPF